MTERLASRRDFLKTGGFLVVSVALGPSLINGRRASRRSIAPPADQLDTWIAIGANDRVTVCCGKVELGTGISTALRQIVAEELDVSFDRIDWVQGDTERTPDQGATTGSRSIRGAGPALRQAGATARQALLELAQQRFGVPIDRLVVAEGVISVDGDTTKRVSYGALIGGGRFERRVEANVRLKSADRYAIVGRPVRRAEIPAKVTGTHVYVQDVVVPGMVHGRVVRPPAPGATLASVDESSVRGTPGFIAIVRRESFLGVVADREEQAIAAARRLRATWNAATPLPAQAQLAAALEATPATVRELVAHPEIARHLASADVFEARYQWPYQMHASIGPSCGVADVRDGAATIWSATQGAHQLKAPIGLLLGISADRVHVIWTEGSGCYGHNGADDAAADAAIMSQVVRRPVRVQWSRRDEHQWEPKGPAMLHEMVGVVADGRVAAWNATVWTATHVARPNAQSAATLLAGRLAGIAPPTSGGGGGDRNARTTYKLAAERVVARFLQTSPLRTSALRGLGSPANSFANESFMDELARRAGADPVQFRLRHLDDPRATAVVEAVARLARWTPRTTRATPVAGVVSGRGVAYTRYAGTEAYVAGIVDVDVRRDTGDVRVRRVYIAHDCGLIVNPDGLRNQIEGNVIQAISRSVKEEVKFDTQQVTSGDWASYPILSFTEVPDAIEIELIDRPSEPSMGGGEPATSVVAPAIANAIADATGVRIRTIPLTRARVREALG
jgi:nicotinate dehydrogenase subunit B